jgi:hypothetical protein
MAVVKRDKQMAQPQLRQMQIPEAEVVVKAVAPEQEAQEQTEVLALSLFVT